MPLARPLRPPCTSADAPHGKRRCAPFARSLPVLFALLAAACGSAAPVAEEATAQGPMVSVIVVAPFESDQTVRASGVLAFTRETPLAFNVPGVIASLTVDEGDAVAAGQRLASLQLTAVQAGASEASAALETAERNLARAQTLFDRGLVAQARLDDARLAVERARAGRAAAGFNRDTAMITAPAAGVVLRRLAEPAQVVGAGQPVLLLGETRSGLIARAGVASNQAGRIAVGARAVVRLETDAGEIVRDGRVQRIAAKTDAATGGFDVEVAILDASGLRSGMVAATEIDLETAGGGAPAAGAVSVPTMALLDARADQAIVYVLDQNDLPQRRTVRTGGVEGRSVVVLEGLAPGDRVIATGAAFVRAGEPVRLEAAP